MRRTRQRIGLLALTVALSLPTLAALPPPPAAAKADAPRQAAGKDDASAQVDAIADDYLAAVLDFDPGPAYQTGLPLKRHDYLPHNAAADLRAFERREDGLWQRFSAIDRAAVGDDGAQLLYAQLREMLQASRGMRVCKAEGWNVNHMGGWQNNLADLADRQPVATAEERKQALTRWRGFPGYVDNEIVNLRAGLKAGYSAPKTLGARGRNRRRRTLAAGRRRETGAAQRGCRAGKGSALVADQTPAAAARAAALAAQTASPVGPDAVAARACCAAPGRARQEAPAASDRRRSAAGERKRRCSIRGSDRGIEAAAPTFASARELAFSQPRHARRARTSAKIARCRPARVDGEERNSAGWVQRNEIARSPPGHLPRQCARRRCRAAAESPGRTWPGSTADRLAARVRRVLVAHGQREDARSRSARAPASVARSARREAGEPCVVPGPGQFTARARGIYCAAPSRRPHGERTGAEGGVSPGAWRTPPGRRGTGVLALRAARVARQPARGQLALRDAARHRQAGHLPRQPRPSRRRSPRAPRSPGA
ncbi:DUF885 family protein [Lysobacter capsici]|uniref:DUF885 family protein n=1 Tax=Lysobacter capsici TaxID=435897 RepID=UPI001C008CB8|nr:DUF885 family protein [Lysobacter capsici]QWF15665.1 DUF885 family protein [Lysobacter capsici]